MKMNAFRSFFTALLFCPMAIAQAETADALRPPFHSVEKNIYLLDSSNENFVELTAPSSVSASYTFKFPSSGGTNGDVLSTDGTGLTSWVPNMNPINTTGDIVIGGVSGAPTRLGIGTNGQVLQAGATSPGWAWPHTTVAINADYPMTTTDGYEDILVTTGVNVITITLPAAASSSGRKLVIKKVDNGSGAVSIVAAGSDTIDGAASTSMSGISAQNSSITLVCDGTTWQVVGVAGDEVSQYFTSLFDKSSPTLGTIYDTDGTNTLPSVTLPAGTWDIHVMLPVQVVTNNATGVNSAIVHGYLRQGSTVLQEGIGCYAGGPNTSVTAICAGTIAFTRRVSITSSTTYKLSVSAIQATAGAPTVTDVYVRGDQVAQGAYLIARRVH